jgi:hypothetical protein
VTCTHEFKKRVVYFYECPECGADGHPCEGCGTICDIDVMRSDSESAWFPQPSEGQVTTARERRFAGYLLAAYTDLLDGARGTRSYVPTCTECHCEDCLPKMSKRGCCGLGRALREAVEIHAPRSRARKA